MVKPWMFKGPLLFIFTAAIAAPLTSGLWAMPGYQVATIFLVGIVISIPMYAPRE